MTEKRILRIFPRKTNATPDDALAIVNRGPLLSDWNIEVDEIHISVTWTCDLPAAEMLAHEWRYVAPVSIGGPATGQRSETFVSGRYIKHGYTITSRGCPNRCWFCAVWRRDGDVTRELPIVDGWNILDDNILACSDNHIRAVFNMLSRQKQRPEFTGGLEAKRLREWHAVELRKIRPEQMFFAYDTADDLEPLVYAGRMLLQQGFTPHRALRCYVLMGWPSDTFTEALARLTQAVRAGFMPMAMLYMDKQGNVNQSWRPFAREWIRPAIMRPRIKRMGYSPI